ncbi:polysaccharide deacetylase family protein [Streptomyces corynorhini]|uniref:Polysaccharide deacetylase family protein n=1 Tax=Streptomyces corynorhini TaxID=2282652 RepID=A0A370B5L0_9ACTN|nr:polysaccharide deacetylase family protein [Streptomyces corynorhini]RDG35384.1 polysaccharide deacetylase family protein [Streptomyces corynorhini]
MGRQRVRGTARATRRGGARAGARTGALTAVTVLVGAALLAGCGHQQADDTDGKADGKAGGKATVPRPSGTGHATAVDDKPIAAPRPPELPDQTSRPDAKLPPPLVNMDIAHAAESGGKAVNLTIDDGPDPVWTPKILKILRDNGVKATFCMVGPQAEAHPDIVKRVVAEGHRLCDHSVAHDTGMDHKSRAYQKEQILKAARQIEKASGGVKPLYYRAPGGAFTPYSRQIAAAAGMRPVGWNVDSKDFEEPGTGAILRTVRNELPNGPTLLFHDGGGDRSQTAAALRELVPWLRERGYAFSFPVR